MSETNLYTPPKTEVEVVVITRKRGFWRGLILGYITHWVIILCYIGLSIVVKPFAWPIIYGKKYTLEGPMISGSKEWIITQAVGVVAYYFSGYVSCYWSKPGSWYAPIVLAIISILLIIVYLPNAQSSLLLTIWWFYAPVTIMVGALSCNYYEKKS